MNSSVHSHAHESTDMKQRLLGAGYDPRERLREALDYAKPGPITAPRTSSQKNTALLLISLFTRELTNVPFTLQELNADRAARVISLIEDYINGRFDFADCQIVRAHFWLDPS